MSIAKFRKFIIVFHEAPINMVTATTNLRMVAIKSGELMTTLGKVATNASTSTIRAVLFTVKVRAFITNVQKLTAKLPIVALILPKDIKNLHEFTSILLEVVIN